MGIVVALFLGYVGISAFDITYQDAVKKHQAEIAQSQSE